MALPVKKFRGGEVPRQPSAPERRPSGREQTGRSDSRSVPNIPNSHIPAQKTTRPATVNATANPIPYARSKRMERQEETFEAQGRNVRMNRKQKKERKKQRLKKIALGGKSNLLAKKSAKLIFKGILWAGVPVTLFQLGFFIVYMVGLFTMSMTLDNALDLLGKAIGDLDAAGVYIALAAVTGAGAKEATEFILDIDIGGNIFLFGFIVTLVVGWLSLGITWFVYALPPVGIKTVGSGGKTGILLLVFILHALPPFNVIPWFLIWAWYIQMKPV